MSFRNWVGAIALTGLALAPAMAFAQAATVDDITLDNRIEAKIKASPTLKHDDITVSVENGVVTLTGKVASETHKTRAAALAKIAGVTRVENNLEIDTTLGEKMGKAVDKTVEGTKTAGEKTKDAVGTAGKKTVSGAKKVGEVTKDAAVATGEVVTDAWITTTLKADFVNEDTLKGSDINVDTEDHVVTLKGTVVSLAGKTRAEVIAKGTKGVKTVINTLTIGPKK
jgi:hyperosmotically inducible periplasmic protein